MGVKEFTKYRTMLERKLAQLSSASDKRTDIVIQRAPDLVDEVALTAEREHAVRDLTRGSRLAREIRAALARIDDGSYGACLNCEEEISPKRLDALPWAAYCVRCQEAAERHSLGNSELAPEEAGRNA